MAHRCAVQTKILCKTNDRSVWQAYRAGLGKRLAIQKAGKDFLTVCPEALQPFL